MSHGTLVDADHAQPANVDSPTDNDPPDAAIVSRVRLKLNEHGAPAWLNDAFCEPTAIEPVRGEGTGLAATANGIVASPCPSGAPVMETHGASAEIDHVQSRAADIVADPDPPAAPNEDGVLATETEHLSAEGATTDDDVVEEVQPARRVPPTASSVAARSPKKPIRYIRTSLMHAPRHLERTSCRLRAQADAWLAEKLFPFSASASSAVGSGSAGATSAPRRDRSVRCAGRRVPRQSPPARRATACRTAASPCSRRRVPA